MIAKIGALASKTNLYDWWTVGSATCLCAWQPKGADSDVSAKLDLSGNGNHLTGASPAWSSLNGFTSYVVFSALGITLPYTASFVWAGELEYAVSGDVFALYNSSGTWAGAHMHAYSSDIIYAGYNSASVNRLQGSTVQHSGVYIYTKNESTNAQALYLDDSSLASNSSGSTPTDRSFVLITGVEFWAGGIYDGVLSGADITSITNYLNTL